MKPLIWEFLDAVLPVPTLRTPIADAPLVPSVDELMAMAMNRTRSDFLGDLNPAATALGIALYCGDATITICETWADENTAPPVPLCIQVQLRERLIAAAWERIYASYDEEQEP